MVKPGRRGERTPRISLRSVLSLCLLGQVLDKGAIDSCSVQYGGLPSAMFSQHANRTCARGIACKTRLAASLCMPTQPLSLWVCFGRLVPQGRPRSAVAWLVEVSGGVKQW